MSYVTLDNLPLKIKSISRDPQPNIVNKSYVGGGSFIRNKGFKGRKLDLTVYVGKDQIELFEDLEKKTTPVILTSESKADYNGQYHITEIRPSEGKKGVWNYTITLIEYIEPNIVWANFSTWNVSSNGGGAAGGDSNIITPPLTSCPTLQLGDRGDCVGELQTYLKLLGYYIYSDGHSMDVDNYFGDYTEAAVKAFQADNKLTQTGIVGPETKIKMTL
nr:peptidoglycan-binding domain-containing protein [uncultured Methanobacterium sp.]